jgi:hypothetical protein
MLVHIIQEAGPFLTPEYTPRTLDGVRGKSSAIIGE